MARQQQELSGSGTASGRICRLSILNALWRGRDWRQNQRSGRKPRTDCQSRSAAWKRHARSVLRLLGESSALKNRITQIEAQFASADRDTTRARAEEQQSKNDQARIQQLKSGAVGTSWLPARANF